MCLEIVHRVNILHTLEEIRIEASCWQWWKSFHAHLLEICMDIPAWQCGGVHSRGDWVSAGVSSSGRASLPVAATDVDGPTVVVPKKEVDGAGKALHRCV